MKKRILITGGGGYIGYHIIKELLKDKKNQITVLDSFIYDFSSLNEFIKNPNLTIVKGDICNIYDMVKAIKKQDIVIALAAIVGDPACALNEEQTYVTNFHSIELLIQLCNTYNIKRLIFASSCSVYGESNFILNEGSLVMPLSLYAKTRLLSEDIIRKNLNSNIDWVILRFATVFGWSKRMRFDLVVNFLTSEGLNNKKITIYGKDQWRPLIHVNDVAQAVKLVVNANKNLISHEIFNIGDNRMNLKIKDIAIMIKKYIKGLKIIYKEIPSKDKRNYRVSFNKIQDILGFRAKKTIDFGIKEIIEYIKKYKVDYLDDKYYNVKYIFKNLNKAK